MLVETYPLLHPTNDALQNIYTNLCVMRLCGELSRVKSGTRDCNGFDSQHINLSKRKSLNKLIVKDGE